MAKVINSIPAVNVNVSTSDPTVSDDNTLSYSIGSFWINSTSLQHFVAADVTTGAAIWVGLPSIRGQVAHVEPAQKLPTGTTETFDWDDGNLQSIDLNSATGDVTLTLSNPRAGATYMIKVVQGATARNLIWPAAVKWMDGTSPTITVTDDAIDIVSLYYDGTNYLCSIGQGFA